MDRQNYTVILLTNKRIKQVVNNYWFIDRKEAERYAEGISIGAHMATGTTHAVIMLLNGEYNNECITKNLDCKSQKVFLTEYLWPMQEQEQANELLLTL